MHIDQELQKNIKVCEKQDLHTEHNSKTQKPHHQSQLLFEKNYPKNIFIPIIEYLAEIGFKKEYEECVGSREEFQGKNVVSLGLIHKLMTQPWFEHNTCKRVLISNISNKILMNSKIKKKLFHLFIVRHLFQVMNEDLKQFKKRISKLANSIGEQLYPEDQLFQHPSAILYLLRLFYKIIAGGQSPCNSEKKIKQSMNDLELQGIQLSPQNVSIQVQSADNKNKHGSKQEFKHYIRKIINVFNSQNKGRQFMDNLEIVKETIQFRQNQIQQKYNLPEEVPHWKPFVSLVVQKCFDCFRKSIKVTHSMMNQWIGEFRQQSTTIKGFNSSVRLQKRSTQESRSFPYMFKPVIIQFNFLNQY